MPRDRYGVNENGSFQGYTSNRGNSTMERGIGVVAKKMDDFKEENQEEGVQSTCRLKGQT